MTLSVRVVKVDGEVMTARRCDGAFVGEGRGLIGIEIVKVSD